MNCPECHLENPEGADSCYGCGHNFQLTSKATSQVISFDEKLEKIQRYLPEGIIEKILNQKYKIEGERKQVTVMFCDMEGFTYLVDKLGPEAAYQIMDQVYEILIHNVHNFYGTVNEMTGDGIMALFGAPIALEDAPQRALRSAISIHRDMASFSAKKEGIGPIRMRIGIHTGPVIVGTLGNNLRVEFKAVGNTVNMASRMEKLAKAGSTYVTEETFKQTKELFQFETVGKKSIKGKKESIFVYKVLTAKKEVYRPRLGSERIIYSRMVGRDKEIDRLELQVMKVINGEGSVVNIIGEAGIGKSRLVAELTNRDVMKRVTLLEGRAISVGRNLNFHPIIDILKQWARIREDDGESMALGKLEAAVRSLYPEEFADMLPFVATLMGMKLSGKYAERVRGIEGEALEKLILKSVRELLIKTTELNPLVIVAEDYHWADTSSIELMGSLFRLAEIQRILFINVFRPGQKETRDRIVETLKRTPGVNYVEIALEPLNEKMSEVLIANMLNIGELRQSIIRSIVQRAGGNPFFIEEVIRSFIDEGAIVLKNGQFEMTDRIETVSVPHTINDVLMARIDSLDEGTRDLVKIASVIGRNFFYRILSEVANTVEDIDSKLLYLKEIQLLRERRRMGEVEYLFKHALAQEAAYESILPINRKRQHLKVAQSIEKVFGERLHEFYGMLAYHFSRTDSIDKAEEYMIRAGEEALKSSASSEALYNYQEALRLYLKKYADGVDPEKVAMFDKNIALALHNKGQYDEAIKYFDKALNYYWVGLPKGPIAAIFKSLSAFLHFIIVLYLPSLKFKKVPKQRENEALDLFIKKIKMLAIINPKRFFIESFHFYKRLTNYDLTKFKAGLGMLVSGSTLFSFTGISFGLSGKILDFVKNRVDRDDIKTYIIYDFALTLHNYFEGNWKKIKEYDEDLINKNLSIGEVYWASQHLYWHGLAKIDQGDFCIPKLLVNKLNDIFEVYENDLSMLLKYLLNTNLLMECCTLPYALVEIENALVEIEKGIGFAEKSGQGQSLIHMCSYKAQLHILDGEIEKAEKSLERVKEIRCAVNTVPWQSSAFYRSQLKYDLYLLKESKRSGQETGSSKYRKKVKKSGKMLLKQSKKVAQYRTESYKLMGVYYWLTGKQNKALKWWDRSVKEGERLGARLQLARTYFEVGQCLNEAESKHKMLNGIEAQEYLDRAELLFEEMKLNWASDGLG